MKNVATAVERLREHYTALGLLFLEAEQDGIDAELAERITDAFVGMPPPIHDALVRSGRAIAKALTGMTVVVDSDSDVITEDTHDAIESVAAMKIRQALAQAESPLPGQAPAVECAVVLNCGVTIQGGLSLTEDGDLRMMSQAGAPGPDGIPMVEQFFGFEDVAVVGFPRRVIVERPRILHPA